MNPLDPIVRVVRTNPTDPDPALNLATDPDNLSRFVAYRRDRDPEKAPLVEGKTPTWFYVRRLPAAYVASVIDGIYPRAAQRIHAVRAAVCRVELAEGDALTPTAPTDASFGVSLAPDAWAQDLADRFGAETLQELGEVALDLSRLPKGRRGPFSPWAGTAAGL